MASSALARARLAIACTKMGDKAAARDHFSRAEPFLTLHKDESTLRRCRAALGRS